MPCDGRGPGGWVGGGKKGEEEGGISVRLDAKRSSDVIKQVKSK